jgi:hypothetical protein
MIVIFVSQYLRLWDKICTLVYMIKMKLFGQFFPTYNIFLLAFKFFYLLISYIFVFQIYPMSW